MNYVYIPTHNYMHANKRVRVHVLSTRTNVCVCVCVCECVCVFVYVCHVLECAHFSHANHAASINAAENAH